MLSNVISLIWGRENMPPASLEEGTKDGKLSHNTSSQDSLALCPTDPLLTDFDVTEPQVTAVRLGSLSECEEGEWVIVSKTDSSSVVSLRHHAPSEDSEERFVTDHEEPVGGTVHERYPRTAGFNQQSANFLQTLSVLKSAQKVQHQYEERHLKLKQLKRQNRARDVASSGSGRAKRHNRLYGERCSRIVKSRRC